jgi:XTP/dITP diphosphohydrolase
VKIVLASGNQGKLEEFKALLSPYEFTVLPQSDFQVPDVEETGLSFVENAIIKARHAARISGFPALADDSGITIDALHGAPGIYSARFAGEQASDADNINKALTQLKDTPPAQRGAAFHCVLVLMRHPEDPIPLICHGQWRGSILEAPRGENGFGYDPVFQVPEHQCSAAELTREMKNRISHRGQALQQLVNMIKARPL